jgi:hypothetical protein
MIADTRASDDCLSDLWLDRLLAQELEGGGRLAAEHHLARCRSCRARFETLSAESVAFARLNLPFPLDRTQPQADGGLPPTSRKRWRSAAALGALAAGLGTLLLLFRPAERLAHLGERTKGAGKPLEYFVLRQGAVLEGRADQPLYPGDAVQFVYAAPDAGFVAIMSVDGVGKASVYYPTGARAAPVQPGRHPLPQSTVLDGTPGRETIYAFFCRTPVLLEPLRAALAARPRELAPPGDCAVETLSYQKKAQ